MKGWATNIRIGTTIRTAMRANCITSETVLVFSSAVLKLSSFVDEDGFENNFMTLLIYTIIRKLERKNKPDKKPYQITSFSVFCGTIQTMHYIVGLGNPGEEYKDTRHNVGWRVMNLVLQAWNLPSLIPENKYHGFTTIGGYEQHPVRILYPTTYMNKSGTAVEKFVPKKDIEDLIVVHDDIDLPFGQIRVGKGRGAGGNNGVNSIIDKLGSKDFIRVRIGIAQTGLLSGKSKRPAGGRALEKFVLKPFSPKEQERLPEVLQTAQKAIETILTDGVEAAMNQFNEQKK